MNDAPSSLQSAMLAGIPHGFFGRAGGVSSGIYAGLNVGLGSDDDPAAIAENRRRVVQAANPGAELTTLYQVHSADVVIVETAFDLTDRPKADAMVTDRPGFLLGILTADCGPVLFADSKAGVIGAAHAGWKGALAGVTDSTIAAMEKLGAIRGNICAAIGPCIARASYEVDEGFFRRFTDGDAENERFFALGREGHHQFDLEGYIVHRLAIAGVKRVDALGQDTYGAPDAYFSFRRSTHNAEPGYGRQISVIGLPH